MTEEKKEHIEVYFYSKAEIESVSEEGLINNSRLQYLDLPYYAAVKYCLDKDKAKMLSNKATLIDTLLPNYIYKIELDQNNKNIRNYNSKFSKDDFDKLTVLLSAEHKNVSNRHIINLSIDKTIRNNFLEISQFLGEDRTYKLFEKIGIHALKSSDEVEVISNDIEHKIEYEIDFSTKDKFKNEFQKKIDTHLIIDDKKPVRDSLIKFFNDFSLAFVSSALNNSNVFKIVSKCINNVDMLFNDSDNSTKVNKQDIEASLIEINKKKIELFIKENPNKKGVLSRLFKTMYDNNNHNNVNFPKTIHDIEEFCDRSFGLGGYNGSAKRIVNKTKDSFILKEHKNSAACKAEFEAYKLYEAFGVDVPESVLIEENNRTILLLEFIDGNPIGDLQFRPNKFKNNEEGLVYELDFVRRKVASNLVIDAILGNYDSGSVHLNNLIYLSEKKLIIRIDPGAALEYNHDETLKNIETDFYASKYLKWSSNSIVDYFSFLREGTYHVASEASANYSNISNQEILDDLYSAELCLPKVKKVASEENYKIIEQRVSIAINHFENLLSLEKNINNKNVKSSFFDYRDKNLGFSDIVMGIKKQEIKI